MDIKQVPVPPEAREENPNGGYESALDNAALSISRDLKTKYGQVEDRMLALPSTTDAAGVFEFYEKTLSVKGFSRNQDFARSGRNYDLAVWRDGNGDAVAAAVIQPGTDAQGQPLKFLVVYLAR